jgi:hypothetical protein
LTLNARELPLKRPIENGGAEAPPFTLSGGRDSASGNELEELEGRDDLLDIVGAGDEAELPGLCVIEYQDEVPVIHHMHLHELFRECAALDEQRSDLGWIRLSRFEELVDRGLDLGNRLLEGLLGLTVNLVDQVPILDLLTSATAIRAIRILFISLSFLEFSFCDRSLRVTAF